jgi:hypothetical protein
VKLEKLTSTRPACAGFDPDRARSRSTLATSELLLPPARGGHLGRYAALALTAAVLAPLSYA